MKKLFVLLLIVAIFMSGVFVRDVIRWLSAPELPDNSMVYLVLYGEDDEEPVIATYAPEGKQWVLRNVIQGHLDTESLVRLFSMINYDPRELMKPD